MGAGRVAARGERVAGRDRAVPASAALRMSCATPCATPSWISGSGPFAVPSASNERGRVRGWAGESARLIAGAATVSPSLPVERAAALGVGEAVERASGEQVAQPADRVRLEHHRVFAGRQLGRLAAGSAPSARPARRARARRGRRPPPSCAAAYPLRPFGAMQMTFMKASVRRSAPALPSPSAQRLLLLGHRPDPVRLDAVPAATAKAASSAAARPPDRAPRSPRRIDGQRRGVAGSCGGVRTRREAREPALAGHGGRLGGQPRALARSRRSRRRPPRWSTRGPRDPSSGTAMLDREVVDRRGLCRPARREAQHQRALVRDESETSPAPPSRPRAPRARRPLTPRPTSTSRKRAGGAAVGDPHHLAGLALPAVEQRDEPPLGRRADGVAAAPELGRHARVARVAQEPAALAAPDLPGGLALELEVEPAVVDRPRAVRLDQEAVVGGGDQVVEAAGVAGLEVHVRHPHDRLAGEAVGAHAAAGAVEPDLGRGLARGEESGQHAVADDRDGRGPPRPRRPSGSCRGRPAWWRRR